LSPLRLPAIFDRNGARGDLLPSAAEAASPLPRARLMNHAKKVVIVTEKVILDGVLRIVEASGATGYTVIAAGGKGSRNIRTQDRPSVVDSFSNVMVEVITSSDEVADRIAHEVATAYFENYSGIIYLEDVEVLRPGKFERH
jgi:nitrogen regulatory protein PII